MADGVLPLRHAGLHNCVPWEILCEIQWRPKKRRMWLSPCSSARVPRLDSTLEILFLTAFAVFLSVHSSQSAQRALAEGEVPLTPFPFAHLPGLFGLIGWNEQGGKIAQAVRNRISSVLSNLGNRAEGEGDSHFSLILGHPCPSLTVKRSSFFPPPVKTAHPCCFLARSISGISRHCPPPRCVSYASTELSALPDSASGSRPMRVVECSTKCLYIS